MPKTVIVGGGISGLATAYYLQESTGGSNDFVVIEGSSRWGGKVTSAHENGFLVEGGPDSFLAQKRATLELCRALGLEQDLISSGTPDGPATYVWSNGRLHAMPEGMMLMAPTMILPMLRSRLISWRGKLRLAMEPFIARRRGDFDESLGSFVRRRLGAEMLDKIAGPLMGGIYSANPERLSLRSTFPIFAEMEREHGSLLVALLKKKKQPSGGKHKAMFLSLKGGVQQLTDALVRGIDAKHLRLETKVLSIEGNGGRYRLVLSDGSSMFADNIVFTTPAYTTAHIVEGFDAMLAARLRTIRYISTATVSLGFRRSDVTAPLLGLGFIVPHSEGRRINACSWSSQKFSGRAPDDCVLLRVFVGGALTEEYAEQEEDALIELARQELREILGITTVPVLASAYRWHKASPQYEVGHKARVAEIEELAGQHAGIYLAGSGFHGAGIPDCVACGMELALEIVKRESQEVSEQEEIREIANAIR